MSTDEPAIVVDDVAKRFKLIHERNATLKATVMRGMRRIRYEEFWALQGVSFEVPRGSTFALIGENGSGKSTMLKCLARIYRPDRGRIATVGKVSALLELGAGFHPELSGRENVFLNGSILGLSKREITERFDDIVSFAGLERFIDAPVKNYSSGMFVRLGFSVAINVDPDILLVDEVLAVGDEAFAQKCLEKFAELRRQGKTVVVVSHGLDVVRNICDEAVWLDKGLVQAAGSSSSVVARYLDHVRAQRRTEEATGEHPVVVAGDISGAASIGELRLVDDSGRPVDLLTQGQQVVIEMEIEVSDGGSAVAVLDLFRTDGVHVGGVQRELQSADGPRHTIRYQIDELRLHQGVYEVSATVLDPHHEEVWARRDHGLRFDVTATEVGRGIVPLGGRWAAADEVDPAGKFTR